MQVRSQISRRRALQLSALAGLAGVIPGADRDVMAADDAVAPVPIELPRDEGVHEDALTEWWYYTGHMQAADGRLFGFEHVFFKARRGALSGWAAHCAVTDVAGERFTYDQKAVLEDPAIIGPEPGMDFVIDGWAIKGINGSDKLRGTIPGYAFALELEATKPPVQHGGDGYLSNGIGAASYYYSRTRMTVTGQLLIDGEEPLEVSGEAWMDHQWGPFTNFSEGGWDWWSVQLDDDTEVMLYTIRDADGVQTMAVGTVVEADGSAIDVPSASISIVSTGTWTSPHSGGEYPSGWQIDLPEQELSLAIDPVLLDQELDTRSSTGVTYWEGLVTISGTRGAAEVDGLGYTELTGYAAEQDVVVP